MLSDILIISLAKGLNCIKRKEDDFFYNYLIVQQVITKVDIYVYIKQ